MKTQKNTILLDKNWRKQISQKNLQASVLPDAQGECLDWFVSGISFSIGYVNFLYH